MYINLNYFNKLISTWNFQFLVQEHKPSQGNIFLSTSTFMKDTCQKDP